MNFPTLFTGLSGNGAFVARFMGRFEHEAGETGRKFYSFSLAVDLPDGKTIVLSDTDDDPNAYREGDVVTLSNAVARLARDPETGSPVLTQLKSGRSDSAPMRQSACYRLGQLDPTQPVGIDIRSRGAGIAKVRRRHDSPATDVEAENHEPETRSVREERAALLAARERS